MNIIERAFELARSGQYRSVDDLEKQLVSEQHADARAQLMAPSLRKELRAVMAQRRRG